MVIFHSYVSLPEGMNRTEKIRKNIGFWQKKQVEPGVAGLSSGWVQTEETHVFVESNNALQLLNIALEKTGNTQFRIGK